MAAVALAGGVVGQNAAAQTAAAGRFPLDADAIARALHADGFEVRANEVRLPMSLTATVENPRLEFTGAERLPNGRMRVRLHCKTPNQCNAFSVMLERSPASAQPAGLATVAAVEPPAPSAAMAPITIESEKPAPPPLPTPLTPAMFGVGAKLTLLLDSGHMHIHLPVIALDSAASGSEVRVSTPDHKQVFRATVVDATTVKGIVQ